MFRPIGDTSGKTGSAPTLQKGTWLFSTDGTAVFFFMTTDTDKPYYYLNAAQETIGPKTLVQLKEMMEKGEVTADTLIASVGDPKWNRLSVILSGAREMAEDGEIGVCPQCGESLRSEDGHLPQLCPACSFVVDTPHETKNLLANFWFTLTKKYCCFRGRATRAEYWSFVFMVWLFTQGFGYLSNAIRGAVLGISITRAEVEEKLSSMPESADLTEFFRPVAECLLQAMGVLPPEGVVTSAYLINLGLLVLQELVLLAFVLPGWGVTVRRLHDVGRSGKWFAAYLILSAGLWGCLISFLLRFFHALEGGGAAWDTATLVLGGSVILVASLLVLIVILLLVFCVLDSRRGSNKYGPSPKYPLGN